MGKISCVLKTAPEFKEAAERLNLHEDILESIVTDYINLEGNKEKFPPDSYIEEALKPTKRRIFTTLDIYEYAHDTWELQYKNSNYSTLKEALEDIRTSFYGEGEYVIIHRKDGSYSVNFAEPLFETTHSEEPTKGTQQRLAPKIVFNEEQEEAIEAALKHIQDVRAGKTKQKYFLIRGWGGVGKTTVVDEILKRFTTSNKFYRPIVLMGALSHKATTVLQDKNSEEVKDKFVMQYKTIAGMLGMRKQPDDSFAPIKGLRAPIDSASIVIIDEASMVNEEQLAYIENAVKNTNTPVIFLGDAGLLPPIRLSHYYRSSKNKIKEDALSPIFTDKNIPQVRLTKRVRQGEDSPILSYSDRLWNYAMGKTENYPNDVRQKSKVTDRGALIVQNSEIDLAELLVPLFKQAKEEGNPNLVKIVAYTTNERKGAGEPAVSKWNRKIRKALYPGRTDEGFYDKELVVFNSSFGEELGAIPNSFEGAVIKAGDIEVRSYKGSRQYPKEIRDELLDIEIQMLTIKDPHGTIVTVPALVPTKENKQKHAANRDVLSKYRTYVYNEDRKNGTHNYPVAKERYETYVNLAAADIGYAYAISSHKSQGSTYDVVAVDLHDINSVKATSKQTKARSAYVAVTRARNITIVSSDTTNDNRIFTDIKGINDNINGVREGTKTEGSFTPAYEEGDFKTVTEKSAETLVRGKGTFKVVEIDDSDIPEYAKNGEVGDYSDEEAFDWDSEETTEDDTEEDEEEETSDESLTELERAHKHFVSIQTLTGANIKFDKKSHTYAVNGKQADYSVTQFKDEYLDIDREEDNDFLRISSRLGNTHDAILRDYFADNVLNAYPNVTAALLKQLLKEAKKLKQYLEKAFGEDLIFITDEALLKVAGKVAYEENEYVVAGTMDMVVIDSKGNIHIVDFKTHRANSSEELSEDKKGEYTVQLTMYKNLLKNQLGEDTKVRKTIIALFNLKYGDPRRHSYSFARTSDQVYVEEKGESIKIQTSSKYEPGVLQTPFSLRTEFLDLTFTPIKTQLLERAESKRTVKGISSNTTIDVTSYNKQYALLSNFGKKPFSANGKDFATVEHYFGWCKAIHCKNYAMAETIRKAPTAKRAKLLHSHVLKMTPAQIKSWNAMSDNVMRKGMHEAFAQNEKAAELLLSTGSAKLTHSIDENSPFPEILMQIREELGGSEASNISLSEEKTASTPTTSNEHFVVSKQDYKGRTVENAEWSDVTLALALTFITPGEKATKSAAGDKYAGSMLTLGKKGNLLYNKAGLNKVISMAENIEGGIKLNVTGNAINNFDKDIEQEDVDEAVYNALKYLVDREVEIAEVRSGGQTGVDEAAIKAAKRLGLKYSINAPKNWKFRVRANNSKGYQDIESKEKFIARFEDNKTTTTKGNTTSSEDINDTKGTANDVERFNNEKESEAVISSDKTILSNEELKYWNKKGVGESPRILVASEHSDPVFHVAEILRVLEGVRTVTAKFSDKPLTGKDFAGLYIITKHDGLPMLKLLETKIPKLIHFSITGLGGTKYEPGSMKYNDLLDRIEDYIKQGLDPECVTIRVDPIVPGVTKESDIEAIVKRASEMGIKRIRFSVMDAYPKTIEEMEGEDINYDFDKYYGPNTSKKYKSKYEFHAKKEYLDKIANFMLSLKDKYNITLGTCAEPLMRPGISKEGCLSVAAVNNMLGTSFEDKGTDNNDLRKLCSCFGGKVDALAYNDKCATHCVYCYAKHASDKAMEYYNEDGTLKNNGFTQSRRPSPKIQLKKYDRKTAEANPKTLYIFTDNTDRDSGKTLIPDDSWYAKKYGKGHHFPTVTTALIRGLDNARPISTQRWYHDGAKGKSGQWKDEDFEEFKRVIDEEVNDIIEAWQSGEYDNVVFPEGDGFFNSTISEITDIRVPKLKKYLEEKIKELKAAINDEEYVSPEQRIKLAEENLKRTRRLEVAAESRPLQEFTDDFFTLSLNTETPEGFTASFVLNMKEGERADSNNLRKLKSLTLCMPYSSIISFNTENVDVNLVDTIFELLKDGSLYPVWGTTKVLLDPDSEAGIEAFMLAEAANKELTNKSFRYDQETGELWIPLFTVGYSLAEIEKRKKKNALFNNSLLTLGELRDLSKAAIYKLSEFITMIQTNVNGYEYFFKTDDASWELDKNKDVDFTLLSRILIIKKIGLHNLFNLVKDRVFNSEYKDDSFSERTIDKLDVIYDNWEAFIELGYDSLIDVEEIALNEREDVKQDISDVFEGESEDVIQEVFGSALEHWQVGFRQVSAFSSLSQLIKKTMDTLYQLDENGNQITDEFGLAKHLNPQEAVAKILHYVQGARDINQMIELLKNRVQEEPWLIQVTNLLEDQYDDLGNLTRKADEQFKSQFYSNFLKYFLKYAITFKDKKGDIKLKVINEQAYADTSLQESRAKEASFATGAFKLKTREGKLNYEVLDKIKKLQKYFNETSQDVLKRKGKIGELIDLNEYHKALKEVFDLLDIETPYDDNLYTLFGVKKNLKTLADKLGYLIDNIKEDTSITSLRDYQKLVLLVSKEMGLEMESVSYEAGKMYYSYVLPSYLGRLVSKLRKDNYSDEEYDNFLQQEYLKYQWFSKDGKIRNRWLRRLKNSKEARENFLHVTSLHFLGKEYKDKTPVEYIASMVRAYFYDNNKKWAYFRVPIMSNKPSEEYIKFERITTDFKNTITSYMVDVFLQELDRIQAVRERNGHIRGIDGINEDLKIYSKGKKVTFDKNGLKFSFEDYLNKYLDDSFKTRPEYDKLSEKEQEEEKEFHLLLNKKLQGEMSEENNDNARLLELFSIMTKRSIDAKYLEAKKQWQDEGFIKLDKEGKISDIFSGLHLSEEDLQEFYWNDMFAATLILQLTITDTAFYRDTEDLQKRLAQVHSPGMQANVLAVDANGVRYSKDGIARTIYLKDDVVVSSVYKNVKQSFELILADTPLKDRAKVRKQLNSILEAYKEINFADAQGYSSPTSYRKKMGLFGKWDARMEEAYQAIMHPEQHPDTSLSDLLDVLWQPLKPFVYSQIEKIGHNLTMPLLKVGVQNKNSEYVLLMADALMRRTKTPNKLKAIYDFMEESLKDAQGNPNGLGIDTVQFMSAVNVGATGVIDINDVRDANGKVTHYLTEDEIKERLNRAYDTDTESGYSNDYVHEIPFEDYIILQEVPAHFRNHRQAHGSLDRILTFTDMLDVDPNTGDTNYLVIDGNLVSVALAKLDYFKAIADNINDSVLQLVLRFNLGSYDVRQRNIALSRVLKDAILRDGRYGSDLLWACDTNEYGEFNIPLSDPIQSNRILSLLNSVIKNTINKQEIAGGPVVQVSSWGTSDALNIRFKTDDGELLLTEREFDEEDFPEDYSSKYKLKENGQTYEDYIINLAGVAYFECYAPIQNEDIVRDFTKTDENGNEYIDIKAIEKECPELLTLIGYRIPTESKYSMMPMKIKGFLPRNAGEGIMLPAELTLLTGGDFDVDKLYMMAYSIRRSSKNGKVQYTKPKEGRDYRNNLIISTQLAVLLSKLVQKLLFTPGNFDEPKKYGYLISYVKQEAEKTGRSPLDIYNEAIEKNKDKTIGEFNDWLKDRNYESKNLIFNDVQVQFHKQNMTAGKLIGIFAQANVSHGFISLKEGASLLIPKHDSFTIDGIRIEDEINIDSILTRDGSTNISNYLAALVGASVDAVKDPILNLININATTANMVVSLIRMGFSMEQVSLICSQPIIVDTVKEYGIKRAKGYANILDIINDKIKEMPADIRGIEDIEVNTEELIENLTGEDIQTSYMVLQIFKRMLDISNAFGDITHMTRYNSVTAAVGPFAADTMILKAKVRAFEANEMIPDTTREACHNPILDAFRDGAFAIERRLLGDNMIQASDAFESALQGLSTALGYVRGCPSAVANAFSDFYMSYFVNASSTGSIFDLSNEHKTYMLGLFPKDFLALKDKYKDNSLVASIQYVESDRELFPFLKLRTRGLSSTVIEDFKLAWVSLYENEESRDLARALVEYNFFRGSFGFSPKTFMNLTPNILKKDMNGYISVLNNKNSELLTSDVLRERVIKQFILHNEDFIHQRFGSIDNYNPEPASKGTVIILKESSKKKGRDIGEITQPFIELGGDVYYILSSDKDTVTVLKVDLLGGEEQGYEISLEEDFPKTIFTEKGTKKSKTTDTEIEGFKNGENLTNEGVEILILQLFDIEEIGGLQELPTREAIDRINTALDDLGITCFKLNKKGITVRQVSRALNKVETLTEEEVNKVLNASAKTINDLNLCS